MDEPRKLRSLNAYIAYRKYYTKAFTGVFEQKNISTIMSKMWKEEPNKSSWAVLAKAYSYIRDEQGKDQSGLDEYLEIAVPELGLPSYEDYLFLFDWYYVTENDSGHVECQLARSPNATTGKTVVDIIRKCIDEDYAIDECMNGMVNGMMVVGNPNPGNGNFVDNSFQTLPDPGMYSFARSDFTNNFYVKTTARTLNALERLDRMYNVFNVPVPPMTITQLRDMAAKIAQQQRIREG